MGNLKKRKPIIALILSFITPGLGQLYNGEFRKGIMLYLLGYVVVGFLVLSRLYYTFHGLTLSLAILLGFSSFICLNALFGAKKMKEIHLRPYNKWYIYLAIFLINNVLIQPLASTEIKNNIVKPYRLPGASMEPNLYVGDYLVVDMKSYKWEKPKRGDVVVFEFPKDPSKDYVKRVIGLENEKVEIIRNKVHINDEAINDPWGNYEDDKLTKYKVQADDREFRSCGHPQRVLFRPG